MTDGLTPQIITESVSQATQGIQASVDSQTKIVDGIHETIKKNPIVDKLKELNDTDLEILSQLKEIVPQGLKPLIDALGEIKRDNKEYYDLQSEGEEDKEGEKTGKKDWTESDAARLPAKYTAGALLLSTQINTLFESQNSILNKICDVFSGALDADKKTENKPIFTDEQIKKLSDDICQKISSIKITSTDKTRDKPDGSIKPGENNNKREKNAGGMKGLAEFADDGKKAFTNILKMSALAMALSPLALAAIPGIISINKFIQKTLDLGKKKEDEGKPVDWNKYCEELEEKLKFVQTIKKIISTLSVAALFASILIIASLTGTLGVITAQLFLKQFEKLLEFLVPVGEKANDAISKNYSQHVLQITLLLAGSTLAATLLIPASIAGMVGLLLVWAFLKLFNLVIISALNSLDKRLDSSLKVAQKIGKTFLLLGASILIIALLPLVIVPALIGLGILLGFLAVLSLVGLLLMLPIFAIGINNIKGISFKIAVAFIAFTLALIIIGVVMPMFLPGAMMGIFKVILLFGFFLIVTAIASVLSRDLKKFSIASILLSLSLIIFAVALVVLDFIYKAYLSNPDTQKAVLSIVTVFLLFLIVATVTSLLSGQLVSFTICSFLLTLSLIVFTVSLVVLKLIYDAYLSDPNTQIAVLSILVIFLLFTALAGVAGFLAPNVIIFALASMLLTAAVILFGIMLISLVEISSFLLKNLDSIITGLVGILLIFALTVALGVISIVLVPFLLIIIVASALLAVASIVLLIALVLFNIPLTYLQKNDMVWKMFLLWVFFGLLVLTGILAFISIIALVILVIASILIAITGLLLYIGLYCLNLALNLLVEENLLTKALLLTGLFAVFIVLGVLAIPAMVAIVLIALTSVLFVVAMVALYVGLVALVKVSEKINEFGGKEGISSLMGTITTLFGELPGKLVLLNASIKAGLLAIACSALSSSFKNIAEMYESMMKIKEAQNEVDPVPVFNLVKDLVEMAANAGKQMQGTSKEAAEAFAVSLGAITKAISDTIDIIDEMGRFTSSEGQEKMKVALEGLSGPNGIVPFIKDKIVPVIAGLTGINDKQLNTAKALAPLMDGIKGCVDVIDKMASIQDLNTKVESASNTLDLLAVMFASGGFLGKVGGILGGSKSGGGGVLNQFINALGGLSNPDKAIENMDRAGNIFDAAQKLAEKTTDFGSKFQFSDSTANELGQTLGVLGGLFATSGAWGSVKKFFGGSKAASNTEGPVAEFISSISRLKKVDSTISNIDDAIRLFDKIKDLSSATGGLSPIEVELTENIIKPLISLDEPINRINQLGQAIEKLDKSLNKMSGSNREVLKTIGKISDGSVLTIKFKEERSSSNKNDESSKDQDPLVSLATDVSKICKKVTGEEGSWATPMK